MLPFLQTSCAILLHLHNRKGLMTSGTLFIFWLAYSSIFMVHLSLFDIKISVSFIMEAVKMGTTIFMLFLNCFADVERRQATLLESNKKISPENCASFINKMFFGWFMGFAWRANKKPIKDDEVYDLNSRFTSGKLCERLDGDCKCNQKTKSEKVYAGFLINQFVMANQLLFSF